MKWCANSFQTSYQRKLEDGLPTKWQNINSKKDFENKSSYPLLSQILLFKIYPVFSRSKTKASPVKKMKKVEEVVDEGENMQIVCGKPTIVQVARTYFADHGDSNDFHWVLLANGTFYTFPKTELGPDFDRDDLIAQVEEMSSKAVLCDYKDWECTTYIPLLQFGYPTFCILSCLRQKIGWLIVGESPVWPKTEQQQAAVCYVGRMKYELDCQENKIIAASFSWSAEEK